MIPDLLSVAVRSLAFVAAFQAAGTAFFMAAVGKGLTDATGPIRRLGLIAAAAGVILVLGHLGLEATRMAGDFSGIWDPDLQRLAWTSKSGVSQMVQAAGLFGILIALWKPRRGGALWASLGGVAAVGAFVLSGHTSAHAERAILAPLLALHVLIVGFWFGSLAPLWLVVRLESRSMAAAVLMRFSRIAGWMVPFILLAGLAMGWILAGSISVLRKPYGELLLAKFIGFGVLMLFAAYNRWKLAPALQHASSGTSLRRSIVAEYLLIVVVLSVTAVMTTFFSPD
jgi:putative copper export protein